MSTLLRNYKPPECDTSGMPLNWEQCRKCLRTGVLPTDTYGLMGATTCDQCGGHGSLRAAALAMKAREWRGDGPTGEGWVSTTVVRCEDCGHPMSEGTWSPTGDGAFEQKVWTNQALECLRRGVEPGPDTINRKAWCYTGGLSVHFSPCDKGCDHGGPGRCYENGEWRITDILKWHRQSEHQTEASWRPVDLRVGAAAFGMEGFDPSNPLHVRPFDLRPENLSVLCLRCYAERMR